MDAEDLISHLVCELAPADWEAFRRAAENVLATSPQCWGPGSVYRVLVPLSRSYFLTAAPMPYRSATSFEA